MLVETRTQTQQFELNREDINHFGILRRQVFDSDIFPSLATRIAWFTMNDTTLKGAPETPNTSPVFAYLLNRMNNMLMETLHKAETDNRWDTHYLRLYYGQKYTRQHEPAAPTFNDYMRRNRQIFDQAVNTLLLALEIKNEVPLKADCHWEEIVLLYNKLGKKTPSLPNKIIYVDDPDGGPINDTFWVNLPTRAPYVFAQYGFHLFDTPNGAKVESDPFSFSLAFPFIRPKPKTILPARR
jgi:hypothetical protein